ncbi:MAG: translocation/assembly module TamB domain-containing protein [Ignavibacteria bacterium]
MLPAVIRKGGKILLWALGSVILLLIFLFIFIQTDTFNKYALEYTLNELNSSQQPRKNKINAESIDGNIFSGIRLNKGSVSVYEDTLLSFNYLSVKYDLWGLLDKRIMLHEIILSDPVINASKIKAGDSLIWNFENLFTSNEKDTTPSSPFEWDVNVENFKLENGFIRIAGDSVSPAARWKEKRTIMQMFNFNQTDISNLNIELSAKYYKDFKSINVKNISFNTNSDFTLQKLKLDVNLNEKENSTDLWNFELVTNRTDIKIYRLYVEKFNPFNAFVYEDLGDKNVNINIDIQKFDFDDLTFFLPELNFLDSTVGVKLEATGKYGDLNADNIQVRLTNSTINFKGNIKNLQQPDSLYFDVFGNEITINSKDIKSVYKGDIPDFDALGTINADLHYKGTYRVFNSEFTLNTSAGYADGVLNLDIPNEIYSGYINTKALNPGRVLNNKSLLGNLNLSAKFDGSGFDINKMNTNLIYSMTSSHIGKYDVKYSAGTIHTARGNIAMNIKHVSSMGSANVNGRINIVNMKNPVYNLKGNVHQLDISRITGSPGDKSNLNFAFNVNGRGISPENINGVYKFAISESVYGKYQIPQTPVDAEIQSSNSNGTIKLSTDMVDLDAKGSFKLDKLIDVILYNISQVQEQITQSTGTTGLLSDSTREIRSSLPRNINYDNSDLNFTYNLVTKDSVKLRKILNPFGIGFNGNISGDISNSSGKFSSATKLDVKNFTLQDTVIVVKNMNADFVMNNEYIDGINGVDIMLRAESDRLSFGSNTFDSIITKYNMHGSNADIFFTAGMDTTADAIVKGKLNFGNGSIKADLDTVKFTYGGYNIENKDNWVFSFEEADKIKFEQFDLKSRNAILNISGVLSFNNESDLKIEGNNLKITDIAAIINQADSTYIISSSNDIEGEVTKLLINYKGTFDAPVLNAELATNTLRYKDTDIGIISSKIKYENNIADANLTMQNADNKGQLTIKGTIPYQSPFSGDTSAVFNISSAPVDINFKADNFVLDYFSVLISDAASLRGILNADLSAKGTASDPALTGNLKITKGGYLLPLTGMDYSFDASMSTDNFKLVLDNLKIYNEDDDARHIDLYGTLDFKDLKITDINILAMGDMVLLNKDVEQNEMGVYGYLYAGIGSPPVKITGSLDSLFITGQLLIKDATISSVPLEGSGYNSGDDNFVYTNAGTDSVIYDLDSLIALSAEDYNKLNPFEKFLYKVSGDTVKPRLVNLDLNVKTENNIYASIDFNNLTRDRLFGELKADLDIKTVNGNLQAFGRVDVAGDSYYRFYRDFKLNESNIVFDGNIADPTLDIKGVYSSQKTTEQYGTVTTNDVEVVITIRGNVKNPEVSLNLFQDGSEVSGSDAQSDAITYLLFGRYKSELSASERTSVASSLGASVGSLYASSYLSQTVREILPFIVDAQFNYTEGNVQNTDVELISELGDARVKFGGKLFKDVKNFELVIDYPLNKLLKLNLPETLLLEFAREEKKQTLSTSPSDKLTTEIKILYKIKF